MDDPLRYGACWWCGEPDSLFRLEGARLAGSSPLGLPSTIQTPDERDGFRVCPECAIAFGRAREAHDVELAEAGIRPDFLDDDVGRRVRARIARAMKEGRRAEGG